MQLNLDASAEVPQQPLKQTPQETTSVLPESAKPPSGNQKPPPKTREEKLRDQREYNMLPHVKAKRDARAKERYENDPEFRKRIRVNSDKFYAANPEKMQEWHREYAAEKRATDPQAAIRNTLCSRIWHALVRGKTSPKTESLCSCTLEALRTHLKSTLTDGLTWEQFTQGEVEIDHIKPCKDFDLQIDAQQKLCFHWTNLRLVHWQENRRKGARVAPRAD